MIALKALALITGVFIVVGLLFVLIVWLGTKDLVEPKDEPNISNDYEG